jgi:hypothetical protein
MFIMKKLFLTVFSLIAFIASAQDFSFGIKAGANFAAIGKSDEPLFDPADAFDVPELNFVSSSGGDNGGLTAIYFGVYAEIPVSEVFSIQPELLYSRQGGTQDGSLVFQEGNVNYESTFNLSYLTVPVMAKFYVAKGLSLEAGPQIGFLLKSEVDIEVNNALFASSTTEDVKDFTKSNDFAFNIGAGYQLNSGLNFNLRYNIGLTDAYEDIDAKNSVFQVGVGYTF